MKKFFLAAACAIALGLFAPGAKAETMTDYYYLKMDHHCAQVMHGAKWLGVGTGAIPIPGVGGLITALVTEDCSQHYIRSTAREVRKFRKDYPAIAAKYERRYGNNGLYEASYVTTSSKEGRSRRRPAVHK